MNRRDSDDNRMKSPMSKIVMRLFLHQHFVSVFGFFGSAIVMGTATSELTNERILAFFLVTSTVMLLVQMCLVYSMTWNIGQREHNLVKYGHIGQDMNRGLKAGIYAQIPGALLAIAALALYYAGSPQVYAIYQVLYFPFRWLFALHDRPYMCFLTLLPMPLIANLGYRFGYAFVTIRGKLFFQNPAKAKKKRSNDRRMR